MAIKTIETVAKISAVDATGATFSAVSEKLKAMEGTARRASETAAAVGGNFGGIGTKIDGVSKSISAMGVAIAGAAALGIEKLGELAKTVVEVGVELDKLSRRQQAIGNLTPKQQKPLADQAMSLSRTTGFNVIQTKEAQNELLRRHVAPADVIPMIQVAADYARANQIELAEAAKLLTTGAFAEGVFEKKHTPDELKKALSRIADVATRESQITGLGPSELEETLKGHAAELAGVSPAFLAAQIGVMQKAGVPEPGGVALKFAAQLSKPSPEALATLAALGVDYSKFVKPATGLSAANLSRVSEEGGGQRLNARGLRNVQAIFDNPAIAGDETKLTNALTSKLLEGVEKGDVGKVKKVVKKFLADSIGAVDVEGLEKEIIAKHPSGAQAESIFTKKGGLNFLRLAENANELAGLERDIKGTPPGLAAKEAATQMGGLFGAQQREAAERKNAEAAAAVDSTSVFKALYSAETALEKAFVDASPAVRGLAEAAAAASVALLAVGGLKAIEKRGLAGAAGALLGGTLVGAASVPLVAAGIGAASILGSTPLNAGEDEFARQRRLGLGGGHWLSNQPPAADRFTPGGLGHYGELRGAADVNVKVAVDFVTPDLIANRIDQALSARGNMRADTGISMPRASPR